MKGRINERAPMELVNWYVARAKTEGIERADLIRRALEWYRNSVDKKASKG